VRALDRHCGLIPAADYNAACRYARRENPAWPLTPRDPLLRLAKARKGARRAGWGAMHYGELLQRVVSPVSLPRDPLRPVEWRNAA
jgi:hypothetical protein